MLTYDDVVSKFCLCDIEMYLKVKDGVVVAPVQYAGRKAEEVLRAARGIVVKTEHGGYLHYFVVRKSAYLRNIIVTHKSVIAYRTTAALA